jgi:hypothetical protein
VEDLDGLRGRRSLSSCSALGFSCHLFTISGGHFALLKVCACHSCYPMQRPSERWNEAVPNVLPSLLDNRQPVTKI